MLDRRHFFALSGALAATGLTGCASNTQAPSSNAGSSGACTVFDQARQASVTPAQALQLLQEGNARFVGGTSVHCDLLAQVKATATGQAPFAAVLGCMDSRVPPEIGGLGLVPYENIVGRAEFTTFSLDGSQTLNPLTWWGALRGDRAFLSLRK